MSTPIAKIGRCHSQDLYYKSSFFRILMTRRQTGYKISLALVFMGQVYSSYVHTEY